MIRVGFGYDLHRLVEGRQLILGGVVIPHSKGLHGHSDADVLTHAIIDAIFGGAGLGNIGQHFPDTDPSLRGISSLVLLEKTMELVKQTGFEIQNVDATIVAEQPKLNPYVEQMKKNLSQILEIHLGQISIKPKTNEGVGPEGLQEAISAYAVATLVSINVKEHETEKSP